MVKSVILQVDPKEAISETLDGEVVIIHLHSGAYYSANPIGSEIWAWLETGATEESIVRALAERYGNDEDEISAAVAAYLEQLRAEGIISEVPGDVMGGASPRSGAPRTQEPFEAPVLEVYEDLRALLHADPIHDVMNAGWPHLLEDS